MLTQFQEKQLNWENIYEIIPVIIQHVDSGQVLMLGYMNQKALQETKKSGRVTFFSRKKKCLWIKGQSSNNFLKVIDICVDCDNDTLLILVQPQGPTCHTGTQSCFNNVNDNFSFLFYLETIINSRKTDKSGNSYTNILYNKGIKYIAQKVGEEGLETAIAAILCNKNDIINESADLLYHLLVLLQAQNLNLNNIIFKLRERNIYNKN